MQKCITDLLNMGKLPDAKEILKDKNGYDYISKIQTLIEEIQEPLTIEEAISLAKLFGNDSFFGLANELVRLIETAPEWPISEIFYNSQNPWILSLINREKNYKKNR
ncbi:hypothetical protein [Acinetobacter haemolyticus]|uniref:hypothetical protein n=1 Tax=Acinetobacter haemolyticus TaxID=29430 RepID=UPI0024DE41B7|nr:hypothetical protein [Acinetobacter haemolyticus]